MSGLSQPNRSTEVWRWVAGMIVTALVSYFTAMSTVQQRLEHIDTREDAHFREVMRSIEALRMDFNGVRIEIMAIIKDRP